MKINEKSCIKVLAQVAGFTQQVQRQGLRLAARHLDSDICRAQVELMDIGQNFLNMAKHGEYDTVEEMANAYLLFMQEDEWKCKMEKLANMVKANDAVWSVLKTFVR